MVDKYDILEQKLINAKIPYTRIANSFSTNLIFDQDLQRYAKELDLIKDENNTKIQ